MARLERGEQALDQSDEIGVFLSKFEEELSHDR